MLAVDHLELAQNSPGLEQAIAFSEPIDTKVIYPSITETPVSIITTMGLQRNKFCKIIESNENLL